MKLTAQRKPLAMLLAGAWLPLTISCDPGPLDAVMRVVGDGSWGGRSIVEKDYDCSWYDNRCGGLNINIGFHRHEDD